MPPFLIVLPLETYVREIDHKLLLAYYLHHLFGIPVLLAKDNLALSVSLAYGSCAIYIGKNFYLQPEAQAEFNTCGPKVLNTQLRQLLSKGVHVLFVDEEGGLFLDASDSSCDRDLYWRRLPLNEDERSLHIPNLWMCHWGPYQTHIAKHYLPHLHHFTSGASFIDAAKVYRSSSSVLRSPHASAESIGVISSASPLTLGAYHSLPFYLAFSLFSESWGVSYTQDAFISEISAAAVSKQLFDRGFKVTYRPHPASSGPILRNWLKFCHSCGIHYSEPYKETILSYLSRHRATVHTAPCTTALQSFYLGKPSLYFPHPSSDLPCTLIKEPTYHSLQQIIHNLADPPLSTLTPLFSSLIYDAGHNILNSFDSIASIVESIHRSSNSPPRIHLSRTFFIEFVCADILARLRNFRTWKSPKFKRIYKRDISRNLMIANHLWPNSSSRVVSSSSQHLLLG